MGSSSTSILQLSREAKIHHERWVDNYKYLEELLKDELQKLQADIHATLNDCIFHQRMPASVCTVGPITTERARTKIMNMLRLAARRYQAKKIYRQQMQGIPQ